MEEEIIGNRWKELDYVDRKPRKSDNRWTLHPPHVPLVG